MSTENIKFYLAFAYSDEQLAALLAHAESGKLAWRSCCCFIGIPTAPHTLQGEVPLGEFMPPGGAMHLADARDISFATQAEAEFLHLGHNDELRRERIVPIIKAEMERRANAHVEEEKFTDEPAELAVYRGRL